MTSSDRHLVIVGASLAGTRAARVLRSEGFAGELTIIGGETESPYDRPPLSKKFLTGDSSEADVSLKLPDFGARWLLGTKATTLDIVSQTVSTDQGDMLSYDGLIIATGATPRRIPNLTPDPQANVFELRTLEDARRLRNALRRGPRVAIIGAGFIGVEVASSCCEIGCSEINLVAPIPPLSCLGDAASDKARSLCRDHGVRVWDGQNAIAIERNDKEQTVILEDGTPITADVLIIAVGAEPEVEWLIGSGLALADGIHCDHNGFAKNAENVLAAGDVAAWDTKPGGAPIRAEHWTSAAEQGMIVARSILRKSPETSPIRIPSIWSDHFGTRVQCIGSPSLATYSEIIEGSLDDASFTAELYNEDGLVAVVAYNAPAQIAKSRAILAQQFTENAA